MQHIACAKGQAILPGSRLEPSYLFLSTAEAGSRGWREAQQEKMRGKGRKKIGRGRGGSVDEKARH